MKVKIYQYGNTKKVLKRKWAHNVERKWSQTMLNGNTRNTVLLKLSGSKNAGLPYLSLVVSWSKTV